MELVSAAKMNKAVNQVLATRPYAQTAWNILVDLAAKTDPKFHPLLQRKKVEKIGLVLITSNRGLAGSFNVQIIQTAYKFIKSQKEEGKKVYLITLGKKGQKEVLKWGEEILADFPKHDVVTHLGQIMPLASYLIQEYIKGSFDQVVIAYTDFVSSLKQIPRVRQILPITREDKLLGYVEKEEIKPEEFETELEYLFEPSPDEVLKILLRRLVEVQIYQAILESNASEHAARMMAMRNATEAAEDLVQELTLAYNQARQAAITKELAEISAGKAALET